MNSHARAARRERQAAELLGTRRVHRSRYESAPDVEPVTLRCGTVLSIEVKTRKRLPALLVAHFAHRDQTNRRIAITRFAAWRSERSDVLSWVSRPLLVPRVGERRRVGPAA